MELLGPRTQTRHQIRYEPMVLTVWAPLLVGFRLMLTLFYLIRNSKHEVCSLHTRVDVHRASVSNCHINLEQRRSTSTRFGVVKLLLSRFSRRRFGMIDRRRLVWRMYPPRRCGAFPQFRF